MAQKHLWVVILVLNLCSGKKTGRTVARTSINPFTKTICMASDSNNVLRARHKTCFLRPDTGPCRADILQWYYDVRQRACYRFYWGGCQGNGNRFNTKSECYGYCGLNRRAKAAIPHYCQLAFDFGTCFGHYYRWYFDNLYKTCKRRLYSGCGGNQNNFESSEICWETCIRPPNNTMQGGTQTLTTCIPFDLPDLY